MSGLITDQGNQNANDIQTNKNDIAGNRTDIDTNTQDISNLDTRVTTNETSIQTNRTDIDTNTQDIATVNAKANLNTIRPDQIQSGSVNGSTLSITEQAREGGATKTTDIDMSGLTTNQGNQNAGAIAVEKTRNNIQDAKLQVHSQDIATNRSNITTNSNNIASNYQSIQINAGNIQYEHNWNVDQQKQIDDLSSRTDRFQNDIYNLSTDLQNYGEFMVDSAAGAMAVSTIDFGTVKTEELEIGVGVGMSGGNYIDETSFAAGVGFKYGIDDETAAVAKGWASQHGNYGAGAGVVWKY
jgi:hypothetical protein